MELQKGLCQRLIGHDRAHGLHAESKKEVLAREDVFLADYRRLWFGMNSEHSVETREYPELRPEGFTIVAWCSIEDDCTTQINSLTSCGLVIRTTHESERHIYTLGEIVEKPRIIDDEELEELIALLREVQ